MHKGFFNRAIGMVVLAAAFSISSASAAPLQVVKGGATPGLVARIKTETLGPLKVPNGSVKFSEGNVSVGAVPDWLFDRHVVLTGKVINNSITTAGGTTAVQGLIYFIGGDWLNSFPEFKRQDNVELIDGKILVGKVRAINGDNIDFQVQTGQTRRIKTIEVKSFSSPRAFLFSIPASDVQIDATSGDLTAQAESGTFEPTFTKESRKLFAKKEANPVEPKSVLAGAEGGVTKKQLAGMITLDAINFIAPAIVAPIVAPLGDRGALNKLKEVGIQDQRQQFTPQR